MTPNGTSSRPRLIIADDDSVVRSVLNMSLGEAFEIVGVASDSEEAVELARTSQPDVALVDVDMPRGGGEFAVNGIATAAPDTAIVVLSADESDGLVRTLMQAGATAYLRKGVDTHMLTECLTASIKAHAGQRTGQR
jgi:DNA-binding NarL/FixJ family response regulator